MAENDSLVICGSCEKLIKCKDIKISCNGMCNKTYHGDCVALKDNEIRLLNNSSKESGILWCCPACRISITSLRDVMNMKQEMFDVISNMSQEISKLKDDMNNKFDSLSNEFRECNNGKVAHNLNTRSRPRANGNKSNIAEHKSIRDVNLDHKSSLSESDNGIADMPIEDSSNTENLGDNVDIELNQANQPEESTSGNSWVTVVKKKLRTIEPPKKNIVCGLNKSTGLKIANNGLKRKAVFISRLASEVSSPEISNHLQQNGIPAKVTKLKTKYETYSSFHVEIEEKYLEASLNADLWPEGCLVCEFYGRLREDQKKPEVICNGASLSTGTN